MMFLFKKPWILGYGILSVISIVAVSGACVVVPAGHRAVVFNAFTGVEPRTLADGTHLLMPFVETPVKYDVRTQTYTMSVVYDEGDKKGDDSISALSADGQTVKIDLSVRYHLRPGEVWQLHRDLGSDYVEKVIRPEAQTVVRNVISKYTVTQLYSAERTEIQNSIGDQMRTGLAKYHIELAELLLRNIGFSEAFTNAIEQKQVAMQEAERMKYVLQKEEAEKERKIIAASGEAEAIRRRGLALRENPLLVKYEYVAKLAPNVKAVIADQKTIFSVSDLLDK